MRISSLASTRSSQSSSTASSRRASALIPTLLIWCGATCAAMAETAPAREASGTGTGAALGQVSISDGAALIAHWNASIYGKLWADPALAPLHGLLQQGVDTLGEQTGIDPFTALAAAKGISFRWLGLGKEGDHLPQVAVEADLGGQAAQMMELARKAQWTPATVAGADEALAHEDTHALLARYGHQLRLVFNQAELPTWAVETGKSDMTSRLDVPKMASAIGAVLTDEQADGFAGTFLAWLRAHVGVITSEMRITADGMRDTYVIPAPTSGFIPVDRAMLARIPANAVSVSATGLDGAAWWKEYGELVLGAVAASQPKPADARSAQAKIDETLKALGLPGLPELIGGITGTHLFFMTPGVPMMGMSLVMRRSEVVDLCVRELLARVGEQPPAEGASIMLPVPNMPFTPQLVLDKDCWLLTTDSVLATQWIGVDGGWSASPVGKVVLAHADDKAVMISGTDNAAMIQTMAGYAGMGLAQANGLTPEQKRAIQQGLTRFAALAKPGYGVVRATATGFEADIESVFSSSLVLGLIPAIAIPNMLESRVGAQEAATAAALKSGILPAEVQFQAGGYADGNADGIGEYGFFPELSGAGPAGADGSVTLNLLAPAYNVEKPTINGYRFVVYLPDGKGGAVSTLPAARPKDGAKERERFWVAYAWPSDAKQGRRAFAIDQSGNVYATKPAAKIEEPKWDDLYAGKGWGSTPTWVPYRRGGRRQGQPQAQPDPKANPEF